MTTGPLHWRLLARARALDNQLFVALVSPARDDAASYRAYGHSLVADPWAEVLAEADAGERVLLADVDYERLDAVRRQIPIGAQRRADLYELRDNAAAADSAAK